MSTQQKNGNGLAGTKPASEKTTTVLTPEKKDEKKPVEAVVKNLPAVIELPPLEDRLHRLNVLFNLQQKYNRLQQSLQRLGSFELSKDDETCSITFQDKNRNSFTTNNPELMPEFLKFLKETIKKKIKELEPQLKW